MTVTVSTAELFVDAEVLPTGPARQRRRKGTGGIALLADGRYQPSLPTSKKGKRIYFEPVATREEGERVLEQARRDLAAANMVAVGGTTLRSWGMDFLDKRELSGHLAEKNDRNRWKNYIETAHFIDYPLAAITVKDIKVWRAQVMRRRTRGRGDHRSKKAPIKALAIQTQKHLINLLRRAFAVAEDDGVFDGPNPCTGLKMGDGTHKEVSLEDEMHFLRKEEIETVLMQAPEDSRHIIAFALATGLRQGELRSLHDIDVHLEGKKPYVMVRYGGPPTARHPKGTPPKGKKVRPMPLVPLAVEALKRWYAFRATWNAHNPHGLTFPTKTGAYRREGSVLGREGLARQERWKLILERTGLGRHLEWHGLRHTCATALLSGVFGRKWSLEEVKMALGHKNIKTTEIYAHFVKSILDDAVAETLGTVDYEQCGEPSKEDEEPPVTIENHSVRPAGVEPATFGFEDRKSEKQSRGLGTAFHTTSALSAAEALLQGTASSPRVAAALVDDLVDAVLAHELTRLALQIRETTDPKQRLALALTLCEKLGPLAQPAAEEVTRAS